MSRHNRRRTRGGHLQKTITTANSSSSPNNLPGSLPGWSSPVYMSGPNQVQPSYLFPQPGAQKLWSPSSTGTLDPYAQTKSHPIRSITVPRTGISARHWHDRYTAWQAREKRQQEELSRLETEKCRIFGAPTEQKNGHEFDTEGDKELMEKMLEYFGRLDFIEW